MPELLSGVPQTGGIPQVGAPPIAAKPNDDWDAVDDASDKQAMDDAANAAVLMMDATFAEEDGDYAKAVDLYQRITAVDPQIAHAYWGLAKSRLALKNYGPALEAANKCVALDALAGGLNIAYKETQALCAEAVKSAPAAAALGAAAVASAAVMAGTDVAAGEKCASCGAALAAGAKFCPECGTKI